MSQEDDIIALQESVAFQQAEIDRLSQEVYAQQKEIRTLRTQLDLVIERMKSLLLSSGEGGEADDRPPPHY